MISYVYIIIYISIDVIDVCNPFSTKYPNEDCLEWLIPLQDLLPTRLRVRARLARARAGAEGFGDVKHPKRSRLDGECQDPKRSPKMLDVMILTHYVIPYITFL